MPIAMYVCTHNAYIGMYVFTQPTTDYDQVFYTHTYTHTHLQAASFSFVNCLHVIVTQNVWTTVA